MATELQICRESFTGELTPGRAQTFIANRDVLDPSQPEEAAILKVFGKFFSPVRSTHIYVTAPEPEVVTQAEEPAKEGKS